jgi:transcriptional regulator with PAS, ATPase and Fis domain
MHTKESSLGSYEVCPEFVKALSMLPWRGNIRELSNVIERAVALADHDHELTTSLLPENENSKQGNGELDLVSEFQAHLEKEVSRGECKDLLKMSEEVAIKLALKIDSGNVAKAAKRLGISKPTLYSKIKQNEYLKT